MSLLYCENRNCDILLRTFTTMGCYKYVITWQTTLFKEFFFTKKSRRRHVYLPEIVSPMILFEDMPAEPFWHLQSSALITHLIFSPDVNKDWISLKEAICFLLGWSFTQMLFLESVYIHANYVPRELWLIMKHFQIFLSSSVTNT